MPKLEHDKTVLVRLRAELKAEMEAAADEQRASVSEFIRNAIRDKVEAHKDRVARREGVKND